MLGEMNDGGVAAPADPEDDEDEDASIAVHPTQWQIIWSRHVGQTSEDFSSGCIDADFCT